MKRAWGIPVALVCVAGCVVDHGGPVRHDFQASDRDDAEQVAVNLKMGAGKLRIDTGTDKLAAADFTYSVAAWRPEVRYNKSGGRGTLTIRQPDTGSIHAGHAEYEWD